MKPLIHDDIDSAGLNAIAALQCLLEPAAAGDVNAAGYLLRIAEAAAIDLGMFTRQNPKLAKELASTRMDWPLLVGRSKESQKQVVEFVAALGLGSASIFPAKRSRSETKSTTVTNKWIRHYLPIINADRKRIAAQPAQQPIGKMEKPPKGNALNGMRTRRRERDHLLRNLTDLDAKSAYWWFEVLLDYLCRDNVIFLDEVWDLGRHKFQDYRSVAGNRAHEKQNATRVIGAIEDRFKDSFKKETGFYPKKPTQ